MIVFFFDGAFCLTVVGGGGGVITTGGAIRKIEGPAWETIGRDSNTVTLFVPGKHHFRRLVDGRPPLFAHLLVPLVVE